MAPSIRFFQELDASGEPSPREFLQPLAEQFPKTRAQVVVDFLRPFQLARTGQDGVYRYVDAGRGSGWLRVEGIDPLHLYELERQVEVLTVSQRIGSSDPRQQSEFFGQSTVVRTSNPNIQIGIGAVFAVAGALLALVPLAARPPAAAAIVLLVFGLIIAGCGVAVAVVGLRRRPWWRAARADVRARGEQMPEHLRILD